MGLNKNGFLISFEGIEGSGKSTQIKLLYKYLKLLKKKVIITREPGGTLVAEKLRKIVINDLKNNEDKITELLLILAARADHIKKINYFISKGYIVLCDRFIDSTFVYQHFEQKIPINYINFIQNKLLNVPFPKITFLLDINPLLSKIRVNLRKKKKDRFDKYNKIKMLRIRNYFKKLYLQNKNRIILINGSLNQNQIRNLIINTLVNKKCI